MFNFISSLTLDTLLILISLVLINFIILSRRKIISSKFKLNDYPDKRKIHHIPTPLLGGLCLFVTLIPINYCFYLFGEINSINFLTLTIIYTIFFLIGLWDDIQTLSPKIKTFLIILTLIILLLFDENYLINELQFKYSSRIIHLNIFSFLFTLFCFFSLYNALNFIDGYNGVSLSISIYWILILFIKNPNLVYFTTTIVLIILYFYNLKGKIFLGNSGSSILSTFFAISLIGDYNIYKTIYADEILFLLFIPGIDMIRVTIERIFKKQKIYNPDKLHLHHYLIKNKLSYVWQVTLILTICPYTILRLTNNSELTLIISIILYLLVYLFIKKND